MIESFYTQSSMHRCAVRPALLLAMLVLAIMPHAGQAETPDLEKLQAVQAQELSVLGMTIDHFKVDNVPPLEALKTLWTIALGHEPQAMQFAIDQTDPDTARKIPTIRLDLKNTPAREIVGYIAELSGARWEFRGTTAFNLKLVIAPILEAICRESVKVVILNVNTAAAKHLGLLPGQGVREVMKVLGRYGVLFSETYDHFAAYDANVGTLTMIGAPSETSMAESLVRLANAGMKIELPAKQ